MTSTHPFWMGDPSPPKVSTKTWESMPQGCESIVASWLECSTPDWVVWIWALVGDIVFCSWATYFTLKALLFKPSYLTIIPRAQMGSESIAHEAEGRMRYWLRAHEGERNNCFSKIQLNGRKNIETKHLSLVKAIVLVFKAGAFRY